MTSRLTAMLPVDLRRIAQWWWLELLRRLPNWLAESLHLTKADQLRLVPGDGGYSLFRHGTDGVPTLLGVVRSGDSLPPIPSDSILHLVLSSERLLTRRFTLPTAALPHLRQVVGLDLDRRTPLRADQAYFAAKAAISEPGALDVDVTLSVMPKATARLHLETLAAMGLLPTAIIAQGDDGEIILPIEDGGVLATKRPLDRLLVRVLLVIMTVIGAIWAVQAWRIANLQQAVAAISGPAGSVRADLDQIDALRSKANFASIAKTQVPAMSVVVEVLSRVLPEDTWLTNFRYDGGMISITGITGDSAVLLRLIDESPHFEATQFRSAVVRDPNGKDRFDIVAKVVPHAAP